MPKRLIDVRDLEFFRAVYEDRAFSTAARVLDTVQSNVSTRVARLERRLGVQLFERRYRNLAPTRDGEKLYRASQRVFTALRLLERTVQNPGARKGKLKAVR